MKLLLITLSLMASTNLYSQKDLGESHLLGACGNLYYDSERAYSAAVLNTRYAYFVTDFLAVGGMVDFSSRMVNDRFRDANNVPMGSFLSRRRALFMGPLVRVQPFGSKLSPFVELGYLYGKSWSRVLGFAGTREEPRWSENIHRFRGFLGLNYFITEKMAVEAGVAVEYYSATRSRDYLRFFGNDAETTATHLPIGPQIGFSVFL